MTGDNIDKPTILLVDDSEEVIEIHRTILSNDYTVFSASSGERALEIIPQMKPDVVLLDVTMDGIDGFETCRKIKANEDTANVEVIFISAADTTEEMLVGLQAGAVNYLVKPINPQILTSQVSRVISDKQAKQALADESQMATEAAMIAIASAGEQGILLDFMRACFETFDFQKLAQLIVDSTNAYQLNNVVQIRIGEKTINACESGVMSALEAELLSRLRFAGRIRERGDHLVLNYGNVTQLIKDFPNDEELRGRYKDYLAMIVETGNVQVRAIETKLRLEKVIKETNWVLKDIQSMQQDHREGSLKIVDDMMARVEDIVLGFGLTEEQEVKIQDEMRASIEQYLETVDEGVKIDECMLSISNQLNEIFQINN